MESRSSPLLGVAATKLFESVRLLPKSGNYTTPESGHGLWGNLREEMMQSFLSAADLEGWKVFTHTHGKSGKLRTREWNGHSGLKNQHHVSIEREMSKKSLYFLRDTDTYVDLLNLVQLGIPVMGTHFSPSAPSGVGPDYSWKSKNVDGQVFVEVSKGGSEIREYESWDIRDGTFIFCLSWEEQLKWRFNNRQWGKFFKKSNTRVIAKVSVVQHPVDMNRKLFAIIPERRIQKHHMIPFQKAFTSHVMAEVFGYEHFDRKRTTTPGFVTNQFNVSLNGKTTPVTAVAQSGVDGCVMVPSAVYRGMLSYANGKTTTKASEIASIRPYMAQLCAKASGENEWFRLLNPNLDTTTAGSLLFDAWVAGFKFPPIMPTSHILKHFCEKTTRKDGSTGYTYKVPKDFGLHYTPVNATFHEDGDTGKEYGRKVGPAILTVPSVAPTGGRASDAAGVAGRIDKVKNTAVPPARFIDYARDFSKHLLPDDNAYRHTLIPMDEIIESQDGKLQRIRNGKVMGEMLTTHKDKVLVKSFVKKEFYANINDPRLIAMMPTVHSLLTAQLVLSFKKDILDDEQWFCCGKTPTEISSRIHQVANLFPGRPLVEIDMSRMDGTISEWINNWIDRMNFNRYIHPEDADAVEKLVLLEANCPAIMTHGLKYDTGYARKSGSSINTVNHTLCVMATVYFTLREIVSDNKKRFTSEQAWNLARSITLACGDDVVLVTPFDDFTPKYEEVCKLLGLKAKVLELPYGSPVRFLGRLYENPVVSGRSIQDPARTVPKINLTVSPSDVSDAVAAYNKAVGYLVNDANTAIIGTYCSMLKHLALGEIGLGARATEELIDSDWYREKLKNDTPYWSNRDERGWPTFERKEDSYELVAYGLKALGLEINAEVVEKLDKEINVVRDAAIIGSITWESFTSGVLPDFAFDIPQLDPKVSALIGDKFVEVGSQTGPSVKDATDSSDKSDSQPSTSSSPGTLIRTLSSILNETEQTSSATTATSTPLASASLTKSTSAQQTQPNGNATPANADSSGQPSGKDGPGDGRPGSRGSKKKKQRRKSAKCGIESAADSSVGGSKSGDGNGKGDAACAGPPVSSSSASSGNSNSLSSTGLCQQRSLPPGPNSSGSNSGACGSKRSLPSGKSSAGTRPNDDEKSDSNGKRRRRRGRSRGGADGGGDRFGKCPPRTSAGLSSPSSV